MMSTKIRDDMMEYICIGSESEDRKPIPSQPECKDNELQQDPVGGETYDEHHSGQNGSHVIIEQRRSFNGNYPQKNGCQVPSEETDSLEKYSTIDGNLIPSSQIVAYAEPLKHNGSHVLDKVNISNGGSNKNEPPIPSVEDVGSEKDAKNGLDVHYGKTADSEDVSNNGEGMIKDKMEMNNRVGISIGECQKVSDSHSINNTSLLLTSNLILKEALEKRDEAISFQNAIIEKRGAVIQKRDLVIENQDVVIENTNAQKAEVERDTETLDLLVKEVEDHSSNDEYVAIKGLPTNLSEFEPRRQYQEQVLLSLNSSEMKSKMKEINNLIEHMAASSFKTPTLEVGDKMKSDVHENGPRIESEDESNLEDDESTFPKRKSKESDFVDPEELQLLAKKLKMSNNVSNTFDDQIGKKSQSYVPEQFHLAYDKFVRNLPVQIEKAFNFSEHGESSKEESRSTKEHLDEIADRVLSAMSLDEYFLSKEIEDIDIKQKPKEIQTKKECVSRFAKDGYDFEKFYTDLHPLVGSSPKELRNSYSKTRESEGVIACSRRPSEQGEGSTFSGTNRENYNMHFWTFTTFLDLFKTLVLLNCLFPLFLIFYITIKLLRFCIPSKKYSRDPKTWETAAEKRLGVKGQAPK